MALSAGLERAGTPPALVSTTAHCTLEMIAGKPRITKMRLEVEGSVPGIDGKAFQQAAENAKDGCPVSNALKGNLEFELQATLV